MYNLLRHAFRTIFFRTALLFFSVSLAFLSGAFVFSVRWATKMAEEQRLRQARAVSAYTQQSLDAHLDEVARLLLTLADGDLYASMDRENLEQELRRFRDLASSSVGSIFYLRPGETISDRTYLVSITKPDLQRYHAAARPNVMTWVGPYRSETSAGNAVAFVKPTVKDAGTPDALVAVEVRLDPLGETLCFPLLDQFAAVYLLTSGGEVLAAQSLDPIRRLWINDPAFRANLPATEGVPYRLTYNGGAFVAFTDQSNRLGWKLVFLASASVYDADRRALQQRYLAGAAVSLAMMIVVTALVSHRVTKPIRLLAERVDAVEGDESTLLAPLDRRDELGDLSHSIRNLQERLRSMAAQRVEDQRIRQELEYRALQSQIRPHFLFNTLVCLVSLIQTNRPEETRQMLSTLMTLLRTSIDKTGDYIPLREEFAATEAYITLQRMRFGMFGYESSLDPSIADVLVPKLLLQPLVENSIYHGFSDGLEGAMISVRGEALDENVHLFVSDNGKGFDPEKRVTTEPPPESSKMVSIGLQNVDRRIKLHYGDGYGLWVMSKPGHGTRIEIVLPKRTEMHP